MTGLGSFITEVTCFKSFGEWTLSLCPESKMQKSYLAGPDDLFLNESVCGWSPSLNFFLLLVHPVVLKR